MKHLRQYIKQVIQESIASELAIGAIYCDMDGVLVDFQLGAVELINNELDAAANPNWSSQLKRMRSSVRRVHRDLGRDYRVQPNEDLRRNKSIKNLSYAVISKDPGSFFRGLSAFEDGITHLWPFLNSVGVPVHILSAPISGKGPGGTAEDGKKDWVKRLIPPPTAVEIVEAIYKPKFAIDPNSKKPNILVDDKPATIDEWNRRGGIGILHQPGNSISSINQIKERLSL